MESEDFLAAEDLLKTLIKNETATWIERNDLALCRFMNGDVDDAVSILDRVLEREPGNSFALINRYYIMEAHEVRKSPPPDPRKKVREIIGQGPDDPLVTVVMPTYNRPGLIAESIESVLGQTMPDWELIVVNDGGDKLVERTLEKYLKDPRVRYVYAEHGGLSSAANVGLKLGKGEYLTELDDDDVMYPDHLETIKKGFASRPDIKVVYVDFLRAQQKMQGGQWVTTKREGGIGGDFDPRRLRHGNFLPVCTVCFHRECIETAGLFNERLSRAMDWEFFIRLAGRYDFLHVPAVTGEFRERSGRGQMTRSFDEPWNYNRNLVSFIHGFFPLTGARFIDTRQGHGDRLKQELDRLAARDTDQFFTRRLELRKLLVEPYYALFYTLGKRLSEEGHKNKARDAFRAVVRLRPYEFKAWMRLIKP